MTRHRTRVGPLALVLLAFGAGAGLRLWAMMSLYPAAYQNRDIIRFARVFPRDLFGDYWMPAGYPLLLKLLRGLSDQIAVLTWFQHMAGLGIGLIGYSLARKLNVPHWMAVVTAVPSLLSGDLLFIEHTIAAETVFTLLIALGLLFSAVAIRQGVKPSLIATASLFLTTSGLVRNVGLVLPAVLVVSLCFGLWRSPRKLIRVLAAALVPAFLLVAVYTSMARTAGGYAGLVDMSGWNVYARAAPFADCARFKPPEGTQVLCETAPPAQRPGPYYYQYGEGSPALAHFSIPGAQFGMFALDQKKNGLARQFAYRAIVNQPLDYLSEVAVDIMRYISPEARKRSFSGSTQIYYDFRAAGLWEAEAWLAELLSQRYNGVHVSRRRESLEMLGTYAKHIRFNGAILLVSFIGALIGIFRADEGAVRLVLFLLLAVALALYTVPVLTLSYDYRYGFPAQVPLGWAGLLGLYHGFWRKRWRKDSRVVTELASPENQ